MTINEDAADSSPKTNGNRRWPAILGGAVFLITAIAVGVVALHRDPDPIEAVLDAFTALKNGDTAQWMQLLNAIDAQRTKGGDADVEEFVKELMPSTIDRSSHKVGMNSAVITLLRER